MTDSIEDALTALAHGRPVVVVDSEDRENEGDLVLAAELATQESIAFMIRHTSGLLCVALPAERTVELDLPQMVADNQDSKKTAYTVSADYRHGITTGISARDRALTVRALVDPGCTAGDFVRPGHILPLKARAGGVMEREGHTEAAVDLSRLAGLLPGGVIAEISNEDGSIANFPESLAFARKHELPIITIQQLIAYRKKLEPQRLTGPATLPTPYGVFTLQSYRDPESGVEHAALVMGRLSARDPVLVRVHSECLTGDAFHSLRCDCSAQLEEAMNLIARAGSGVILYLRGHEGRGIGLFEKVKAYVLQDAGLSTLEANLELGHAADSRDYRAAGKILELLGVRSIELLTNNPSKCRALAECGVMVARRIPISVGRNPFNSRYLQDKQSLMGHLTQEDAEDDVAI